MHEDSKSQGFCVRFCGQGMGINPLKKKLISFPRFIVKPFAGNSEKTPAGDHFM